MNVFTCHLESADSVRTNPSRPFANRHFHKLFAEAFVHLLFGERIRSGQVPLFDSNGFVQVIAELLQAKERFEAERKSDAKFIPNFLPVVMTHYEGTSANHRFLNSKTVLYETVASRLLSDGFELSAMPSIGKNLVLRKKLAMEVTHNKTLDPNSLSQSVLNDMGNDAAEIEHFGRLSIIEKYFRSNTAAVEQNQLQRKVDWKITILKSFEMELEPAEAEIRDIVEFYKSIASDSTVVNRSHVYDRSQKLFNDPTRSAIANELVDSLYMWNEARLAGAATETTSSGVEGDDPEVRRQGEAISDWADQSKSAMVASSNQMELRPVLQQGPHDDRNPIASSEYRKELLAGLADFFVDAEFAEFRRQAIKELNFNPDHILEYWQKTLDRVRVHPSLGKMIDIAISHRGIVVVKFREHQLGTKLPGLAADTETSDEIREEFQSNPGMHESQGANMSTG